MSDAKNVRDPYCNYSFRVSWDGRVVAGVTRVSAIRQTTDVVEYREAGDAGATHKLPGRTKFDAITLERGYTRDSEFEAWAKQIFNPDGALQYRKDVRIEVLDEQGRVTAAFKFYRCWPSEFAIVTGRSPPGLLPDSIADAADGRVGARHVDVTHAEQLSSANFLAGTCV